MRCIPLKSMFFLLYNATSFVTIASLAVSELRYCLLEVVGLGSKWCQIGGQHLIHFKNNNAIQPNQYSIRDDNFNQCHRGLFC